MASAQVVETSVANNSPSQDSNHPDDHFQSKYYYFNHYYVELSTRFFPGEKYPIKSHPETSDFQYFSEDMCRSEECRLLHRSCSVLNSYIIADWRSCPPSRKEKIMLKPGAYARGGGVPGAHAPPPQPIKRSAQSSDTGR